MSTAIVRTAEGKDAEGIADVHVSTWQDTYRGLMPESVLNTLSVERWARQWKETLVDVSNPFHPTLVAESDRKSLASQTMAMSVKVTRNIEVSS